MNLAQIQSLLRQVGWPEDQIIKASAIAMYESNGNPAIVNDGSNTGTTEYSVGLFQINTLAHHGYTISQLKDPATNATIALQLWHNRPSYADWYLSNQKYNNDYQGIATQAARVYNNSTSGVDNTQILNTNSDVVSGDDNTGLYVLLGFVALLLLT